MKYLRKIFESTKEDQKEEAEDIFLDLIDDKIIDDHGDTFPRYYDMDDSHSKYMLVTIFTDDVSKTANTMDEFDIILEEEQQRINSLKRIRVYLDRLDHIGFRCSFLRRETNFEIKIFYKESKLELSDAFYGNYDMRRVDENIIKIILKRDYDIEYVSSDKFSGQSGYGRYGQRPGLVIQLRSEVPQKLLEDLRNLKRFTKNWSMNNDEKKDVESAAFYSVNLDGSNIIKIEFY